MGIEHILNIDEDAQFKLALSYLICHSSTIQQPVQHSQLVVYTLHDFKYSHLHIFTSTFCFPAMSYLNLPSVWVYIPLTVMRSSSSSLPANVRAQEKPPSRYFFWVGLKNILLALISRWIIYSPYNKQHP